MLGLKKNKQESQTSTEMHDIEVIPDIFYGGNDPEIYNSTEIKKKNTPEKEPLQSTVPPVEVEKKEPVVPRTVPQRTPPPPLTSPVAVEQTAVESKPVIEKPQPVSSKGHFKFMFVGVIAFVLIGGGASAWFFFLRNEPAEVMDNPIVTEPSTSDIVTISTPPVIVPSTTLSVVTSTVVEPVLTPTTTNRVRALPPLLLSITPDSDNDSLSDEEEEIFQSDPQVWDSDSDGYYDGQEVFNLYNPKGFAPIRIIDSGLVQEYSNPTWKYKVYYPNLWQATAVDARTNEQVLFNSIAGDYIEIKVSQKGTGESFEEWFGRSAVNQSFSDLVSSTNRFSVSYYKRKDNAIAYFETSSQVYMIIYYPLQNDRNIFPHVMTMMAQSFRPVKTAVDIPTQIALPPLPGATSTLDTQSSENSTSTASSTIFN